MLWEIQEMCSTINTGITSTKKKKKKKKATQTKTTTNKQTNKQEKPYFTKR